MKMLTQLGTVIHGTHRPEDLIPAFRDELIAIGRRDTNCNPFIDYPIPCYTLFGNTDDYINELIQLLNNYAPPYAYFGTHEGDGSDFGFWVDHETIETDVYVECLGTDDTHDHQYIDINERGNMELYGRDEDGEWQSIWAIV